MNRLFAGLILLLLGLAQPAAAITYTFDAVAGGISIVGVPTGTPFTVSFVVPNGATDAFPADPHAASYEIQSVSVAFPTLGLFGSGVPTAGSVDIQEGSLDRFQPNALVNISLGAITVRAVNVLLQDSHGTALLNDALPTFLDASMFDGFVVAVFTPGDCCNAVIASSYSVSVVLDSVPEPNAFPMLVLGAGLTGLGFIRRRRTLS